MYTISHVSNPVNRVTQHKEHQQCCLLHSGLSLNTVEGISAHTKTGSSVYCVKVLRAKQIFPSDSQQPASSHCTKLLQHQGKRTSKRPEDHFLVHVLICRLLQAWNIRQKLIMKMLNVIKINVWRPVFQLWSLLQTRVTDHLCIRTGENVFTIFCFQKMLWITKLVPQCFMLPMFCVLQTFYFVIFCPKNWNLAPKMIFLKVKIFKIRNWYKKKWENISLINVSRWFWQIFGDFFQRIFFVPLFKNFLGHTINFWQFLKNAVFSQKSDYL